MHQKLGQKRAIFRVLASGAVVASFLLAGCTGSSSGDANPPSEPAAGCMTCSNPDALRNFTLDAPALPVGRSWTYASTLLYDPVEQLTIVVAQNTSEGYLFAGGTKEDVVGDAMWGRFWNGPQDRGLRDSEEGQGFLLFDFPLEDGKSWAYSSRTNVTAHEATVQTPTGSERGFRIEGESTDEDQNQRLIRYEYAPSIGYLASFHFEFNGEAVDTLSLRSMTSASSYVWYSRGPSTGHCSAGNPDIPPAIPPPAPSPPAKLEVPAGFDAVLASAGATGGGRVIVTQPATAAAPPWQYENAGAEKWGATILPAPEGTWTLTGISAAGSNAWACGAIGAVKWIEAAVGT